MAYQLALPAFISILHDVFHVSQLRKFIPDLFQPILLDIVEVTSDLTFQPQLSRIVDHSVKFLRNKEILLVKVVWEEYHPGESTWELEAKCEPNIRISSGTLINFEDEI